MIRIFAVIICEGDSVMDHIPMEVGGWRLEVGGREALRVLFNMTLPFNLNFHLYTTVGILSM